MAVSVQYFQLALEHLGPIQGLWEYPWPAAFLLDVGFKLGARTWPTYGVVWVGAMLALDATFAWLLWRFGPRQGFYLWMLILPALGPLMLASFDLVPAVLTGAALLALGASRPGLAGAAASLGAAIKLWPAAVLPALLLPGERRARTSVLRGFLVTAAALIGLTLLAAGALRLVSPLIWQERRGLQIEAFAALPLLWARAFDASAWTLRIAESNSYEIQGPGVDLALRLAAAAMIAGVGALAALYWRLYRAPASARAPQTAAALTALIVLVLVCTNKVFSPQYLVWLAPPLAMLGASLSRRDFWIFIAACALTQVVYPFGYARLVLGGVWPLIALTLRDALVILLGARLARALWRG